MSRVHAVPVVCPWFTVAGETTEAQVFTLATSMPRWQSEMVARVSLEVKKALRYAGTH